MNTLLRALLLVLLCAPSGCWLRRTSVSPVPSPTPPPSVSKYARHAGRWVLIESRTKTLTVVDEGAPLEVFESVAFGTAGVGVKHHVGDDVTPRGVFSVGWINRQGKYGPFIGLNYPNRAYVEQGMQEGVIRQAESREILNALEHGTRPPQSTKLGGWIGIHGIGSGKLEIHRLVNWTSGCIALDNQQIRRLLELVRVGMEVEIE